jgi:DNA ligase-1
MRLIFLFLLFIYSNALDIQKPKIYEKNKQDIKNWYMSEKLDGIRAYWNGKEFLSKNGNKIFAPDWFIKDFPPFELDGELWSKRDDFENIQSIILTKNSFKNWHEITYNIFEVPNTKGNFSERLKRIEIWLDKNPNSYIKIIPQVICKDDSHLNSYLKELLNKKAEGIILKNPHLEYESGRSNNLLKVKTFFDEEGLVIGHNFNKDKKFKSLIVELKNGVIFNLGGGFSNKQRENPPKIGETISFKYYGLTKNGKPKFASFLRIRENE